ncbi:MAG: DUF559 domain-containing protein [Acidimicrobiales bacterium]
MAHHVDRLIMKYLAAHQWLATYDALVACGVSRRAVERRVAIGLLDNFGHGVVGIPMTSDSVAQQQVLALLLHPSGVLSHQTAARLHELPVDRNGDPPGPVHVTIPHGGSRVTADVIVHQTLHLPRVDTIERDPLRLTSIERTLCDLAAFFGSARLRWLIEWAVKEQLVDLTSLRACARALNRRGRKGTVRRREVLDLLANDEPLNLSELEVRFLELAVQLGILGLEVQFQPPWYDGRTGIVDFALPHLRIIIEVDGRRWHSLTQDLRRDRDRDRVARANGWTVLRYGWDELTTRPGDVAADLLAAIAQAELTMQP